MYENIVKAVDDVSQIILEAERHIWKNPETGYKEWKTTKYLADHMEKLGYNLTYAENVPGFYTTIDTGKPGPRVLILAELDSLICSEHPEAAPETHAVHCCGHHAQCAAFLGMAYALKNPNVIKDMAGSIKLCAVPAEEGIELEFRKTLKDEGIIKYYSGKEEFLSRGYFDDCDIAFMVHATIGGNCYVVKKGAVGVVTKLIKYEGVASHAGGSPHLGTNALYAANLGINAVNAIRETFEEEDLVRFHPIITKGGDAVNAIPCDVQISAYTRAATFDALKKTTKKINRALAGGAVSLGAKLKISDCVAYSPLINDDRLAKLYIEAAREFDSDAEFIITDKTNTGSTDMGDISLVMPAIHPYVGGAAGHIHGSDYYIKDPVMACVKSAKVQLILLAKLLENNAAKANEIISERKDYLMTKEEYFKTLGAFDFEGDVVYYDEDGKITVTIP